VPARTEAELRAQEPHALVVWMTHADGIVELYAVPDAGLSGAPQVTFAGPEDMESRPEEWAHCVRAMAALGTSGTADEEFYELYVENALWGAVPPPRREELEQTWGSWRRFAVRSAADLDRRFTRVCVLSLAM
jgi:hypothetical protein